MKLQKNSQIFNQKLQQKTLELLHSSPPNLTKAIIYNISNPGKYLRPNLVYTTGKIAEINNAKLTDIACAIELLHTYSLVHDDLPAMDDDDLRRNLPSCHKAFNEATAILAGDCLQTLAIELITTSNNFNATEKITIIKSLCQAIGANGMAGGQYLDLHENNAANLDLIFTLKTGALFQAAMLIPIEIAENILYNTHYSTIKQCAYHTGQAYQWFDDSHDLNCESSKNQAEKHFKLALQTIENNLKYQDLSAQIQVMASL